MKLILGDCLEKLKDLPDNSVDSVVTDPPAGISFMGKEWDTFTENSGIQKVNNVGIFANNSPPRYSNSDLIGFQNFICQVFTEVIRVLKPGGHCLVWAIPRTSHHTAMGLERAGFEIRDCVSHIFGCLSEDTEIFTIEGWKFYKDIIDGWERYHKDIVNTPVLCYNIDKETFEFHKPLNFFIYENKYPAYKIQSDKTDQIVSRNHRVLIERGGRFLFKTAETLERQENIPFLESLPDLSESISDYNKRTGIKEQGLSELYKEKMGEMEYREIQISSKNMPELQKDVSCKIQPQKSKILFTKLQGKSKCKTFASILLKWQGNKKSKEGIKNGEEPCVERWSNLFQKTRKLFTNKICEMSERIFNYGSQRWLCYGTPIGYGKEIKQMPFENRSSTSYKPQSARQRGGKFNVVQLKQRPQITRSTISDIEYNGKVWCVEVPTGAFIARRNGKIFITGNSGFPKSRNIGKDIEKINVGGIKNLKQIGTKQGIKVETGTQGFSYSKEYVAGKSMGGKQISGEIPVYEINNEYEGWGTALKPAVEFWWLCRKPLSEKTVALNVLKWGTGGINIDGCRIEYQNDYDEKHQKDIQKGQLNADNGKFFGGNGKSISSGNLQGRFPANLIHDGSDEVVGMFPNSKGWSSQNHNNFNPYGGNSFNESETERQGFHEGYNDSGSAARFFYCAKASKSERNKGCEGLEKRAITDAKGNGLGRVCNLCGVSQLKPCNCENNTWILPVKSQNNHPTVKPISLMKYLCRLVTPKGGTILDPFLGSGSTGVAAKIEGFDFIGIEKEADYIKIAETRINAWEKEAEQQKLL